MVKKGNEKPDMVVQHLEHFMQNPEQVTAEMRVDVGALELPFNTRFSGLLGKTLDKNNDGDISVIEMDFYFRKSKMVHGLGDHLVQLTGGLELDLPDLPPRTRHFTGRTTELERIAAAVGGAAYVATCVHGAAGSGKSSVLAEVGWREHSNWLVQPKQMLRAPSKLPEVHHQVTLSAAVRPGLNSSQPTTRTACARARGLKFVHFVIHAGRSAGADASPSSTCLA